VNVNDLMQNPNEIESGEAAVDAVQSTMDRLIATGDVDMVYGQPVQHGQNLVIPTAEILSVAGFGVGYGSGTDSQVPANSGGGGGGGGGGRVLARPVAVIIASPDDVRVEPVMDITKVALAALTAFGFVVTTLLRMRSGKI
jgi:uncharacterized spore protein YtfJ